MRENRTECRYAIESPCRIQFKEKNQLVQMVGEIIEISARGGRALFPHEVHVKTIVAVDMDAAPGHPLYGQVIHCQRAGHQWSVGFRVMDNVLPFATFRKLIALGRVILDDKEARQAKESASKEVEPPPCFRLLDLPFPSTVQAVHLAFRKKAKKAHPDHGGDPADFIRLHQAMEEALKLIEVAS